MGLHHHHLHTKFTTSFLRADAMTPDAMGPTLFRVCIFIYVCVLLCGNFVDEFADEFVDKFIGKLVGDFIFNYLFSQQLGSAWKYFIYCYEWWIFDCPNEKGLYLGN